MQTILAIFDFNRTIYNPDTKSFFPEVSKLLKRLTEKNITLILVSKKELAREKILTQAGLDKFFNEIFFVEQKTVSLFEDLIQKYQPSETFVIGDYLPAEISIGNKVGAQTIWLRQGKFSFIKPKEKEVPSHTIKHLKEVLPIIEKAL